MDTAVSRMIRRRAVVALSALLAPTVVAVPTIVALDGLDLLVASLPILLVGVVLIVRLPENWIGWVLACIGFLYATGSAATFVAAAVSRQASVGAGVLVLAWYSEWFWVPMLYLLLVVLPLLLPSGNASMTTAMRVGVAATVIATMSAMFQRDLLTEEIARPLRNPVGFLAVWRGGLLRCAGRAAGCSLSY